MRPAGQGAATQDAAPAPAEGVGILAPPATYTALIFRLLLKIAVSEQALRCDAQFLEHPHPHTCFVVSGCPCPLGGVAATFPSSKCPLLCCSTLRLLCFALTTLPAYALAFGCLSDAHKGAPCSTGLPLGCWAWVPALVWPRPVCFGIDVLHKDHFLSAYTSSLSTDTCGLKSQRKRREAHGKQEAAAPPKGNLFPFWGRLASMIADAGRPC